MDGNARTRESDLQTIIEQAKSIRFGPRAIQLTLDLCTKCGICAEQCHVSRIIGESRVNPAARSDLIGKICKRYSSSWGWLLKHFGAARDIAANELDSWARDLYECNTCRRCAVFCPFGIDSSVITRKGRAIVQALGHSPEMMAETQRISDETGNNEGQTYESFLDACRFLIEEIRDELGHQVEIPIDRQGADILFTPASADLLSFPETHMGVVLFFEVLRRFDGTTWTMSSKAFDAANFGLFTGDDRHLARKNRIVYDACIDLGVKQLVIGECGHAYRVAKRLGPTASKYDNPFTTTSIFYLAAQYLRRGAIKLDRSRIRELVTYHDPCNFSRSTGILEQPRQLLKAMTDRFSEMVPNRTKSWCCGGGGGLAVMDSRENVEKLEGTFYDYRMKIGRIKVEQIEATGATYVAAPCANCKRQIKQLMEHYRTGVKVGGIFDLFARALVMDDSPTTTAAERALITTAQPVPNHQQLPEEV
jgi:Fe-S oxidoreductase